MSLLAELKKKLNAVYDRIDSLKAESDALDDEAYDLDVACRALEEDELYATKDLDEPLEPAEALLDPQPEAASPEFASEQGEPIEEMIATSDAVCEELSEAYTPPQIPEGFTPWSGGECPVSKDQVVELLFRESWAGDGSGRAIYISDPADYADLTQWKHHGQGGDIIAYRVVESPTYAERTEDVSQAETATEQTLITDDIPSIPREEIPIGSAVETYTDSGIETVKLGGQTYVVDGDPAQIEAGKQPAPQIPPELEGLTLAAYAPVNSEPASDALMWANGFEADVKAKAEPEQDKRPFWTRAPKPKVNA